MSTPLIDFQRTIAAALMRPLTRQDTLRGGADAAFAHLLETDDAASLFQQLGRLRRLAQHDGVLGRRQQQRGPPAL